MSIDGVVRSYERTNDGYVELHLMPRGESSPGQRSLIVLTPVEATDLDLFRGLELWGNAQRILVGDLALARREGYSAIHLVDHWQDSIRAWRESHQIRPLSMAEALRQTLRDLTVPQLEDLLVLNILSLQEVLFLLPPEQRTRIQVSLVQCYPDKKKGSQLCALAQRLCQEAFELEQQSYYKK